MNRFPPLGDTVSEIRVTVACEIVIEIRLPVLIIQQKIGSANHQGLPDLVTPANADLLIVENIGSRKYTVSLAVLKIKTQAGFALQPIIKSCHGNIAVDTDSLVFSFQVER